MLMKSVALALFLYSAVPVFAQTSPAPAPTNPDQLFQLSPNLTPSKPQFKLQMPGRSNPFLPLPSPAQVAVQQRPVKPTVDPGMIRKPQGFASQQPRPAEPHSLYPGLMIQPTEMASLTPPQPGNTSSLAILKADGTHLHAMPRSARR